MNKEYLIFWLGVAVAVILTSMVHSCGEAMHLKLDYRNGYIAGYGEGKADLPHRYKHVEKK